MLAFARMVYGPVRAWVGARRRWWYPVAGLVLALGAPAGLVLVRAAWSGAWPGPAFLVQEVLADPLLYGYLTGSTAAAFVTAAYVAGRAADRLGTHATTDSLTGLANRRRLEGELARELAGVRRGAEPLCVLLVDLDHLKTINDRGGHAAGDEALRALAVVLTATCRRGDLVARLGGDEFVVLAPGTGVEEAVRLAERVRAALPEGLAVSVGIAESDLWSTPTGILRRADTALYRAKELGRDRVVASPTR